MRDIELTINRLAQDLIPLKDGIEWFSKSSEAERKEIMHSLDNCIFQSHPSVEDIELGTIKSGLKETFSPCVLIRDISRTPIVELLFLGRRLSGVCLARNLRWVAY